MNGDGTVIGPYKLIRKIGEGAAGVVFLADQTEPVRRQVAVKILKPQAATREGVARFEAERQALALMDHPNIVRILDGGLFPDFLANIQDQSGPCAWSSGVPYFVMELIAGAPITEFCEQHHLSQGKRLELFVQLCRAVQHAHQKRVIHRGLKPADVLVTRQSDGKGLVKLIDFGIAKAAGMRMTERTLFIRSVMPTGTPPYRSPEQSGTGPDVDTRSDIYSLGVLLHEVLTGATPSESKTRLRGNLHRIVMRCLENDRDRRYPTAEALALEIERSRTWWSRVFRI